MKNKGNQRNRPRIMQIIDVVHKDIKTAIIKCTPFVQKDRGRLKHIKEKHKRHRRNKRDTN